MLLDPASTLLNGQLAHTAILFGVPTAPTGQDGQNCRLPTDLSTICRFQQSPPPAPTPITEGQIFPR
ncbi:MAG TPA: hypothetical protein V6D10_05820 [Trichocoleus sp.]